MVLSGRWLCKHRVEDKTKADNEAGRKVGRELYPPVSPLQPEGC